MANLSNANCFREVLLELQGKLEVPKVLGQLVLGF